MTVEIRRAPSRAAQIVEACANDWPRLMYDGFGVMVSPEQEEAWLRQGQAGPRKPGEYKWNWVSGGTRGGKTVWGFGQHADACLYKRGLDNTDRLYWRNYAYGTLAIAPTTDLTLRLWAIGDEMSKGAHDAQYDRKARRSRGGAFIRKFTAGKSGPWPIWRFSNGSFVDFRSSEGMAYRLEGGSWWYATWDEWASQPDREIRSIRVDVLLARMRDHDGKIAPMAWPKPETERHLIEVIRDIEKGTDLDSQVIYISSEKAPWTDPAALEVEKRTKTLSEYKRTVRGEPAGGASKEFKPVVVENMVRMDLGRELREDGYFYLHAWDLGVGNDSTVGHTFRIPVVGGKRVVSPEFKARVVNWSELPGSDTRTLPDLHMAIAERRMAYGGLVAIDATGMGGLMAVRELRDMSPRPLEFKSRSNDRIWGNMRLAAITNGLDCLSWGFDPAVVQVAAEQGVPPPAWGLIESPHIIELEDQLANFDRDAKDVPDDWVWSLLIGLWYIRRLWAVGHPGVHRPTSWDPRKPAAAVREATEGIVTRRRARDQRSRLIQGPAAAPAGIVYIRGGKRFTPGR